jgi:hypothetical protein
MKRESLKRATIVRFLGAIMVLVGLVMLQGLHAQDASRGTWTARWQADKPDRDDDGDYTGKQARSGEYRLQLNMNVGRHNNFGNSYRIEDFKGINLGAVTGAKAPVQFQLTHDAGTIAFDGFFDRGIGAGQFTFTPDAAYNSKMQNLGFDCGGEKQFEMAALDVSLAYAREFKELGFTPACKDVIEGRIFNVNRAQVEELRGLGYTNLPLKKLVELRIFKVDGVYIKQMRAQGMDLSLDKLVESQIFKVTPEFKKQFEDLGYKNLTQEELVAFKIHGVTPEYIRQMRALGFNDLSADDLQQFRIFGVGPDQLNDLKSVGYTGLRAQELVNFKIHGVDSAFIKKVQKHGYQHPSPDKLVEMKIMGIRVKDDDDKDQDEL